MKKCYIGIYDLALYLGVIPSNKSLCIKSKDKAKMAIKIISEYSYKPNYTKNKKAEIKGFDIKIISNKNKCIIKYA